MRVLGIDPGTRHLGWGLLEQGERNRIVHIAHGVIHTPEGAPLAERLVVIDQGLLEVIEAHKPTVGAVETLFFARDAQAAAKLGHARGVVLLRLARAQLGVFEYAPSRVKRAVTGMGGASKEQVAALMSSILKMDLRAGDAADALANAFTHLAMSRFSAALERSGVERSGVALPQPYRPARRKAAPKPRAPKKPA